MGGPTVSADGKLTEIAGVKLAHLDQDGGLLRCSGHDTLADPGGADEGTRAVRTTAQKYMPDLLLQLCALIRLQGHHHLAGWPVATQERRPIVIEIGELETRRDGPRRLFLSKAVDGGI